MLKDGEVWFEGTAAQLRASTDDVPASLPELIEDIMPRTRSLAWSQLKVGIIAVVAIVLATMLVFAVGGESGMFSSATTSRRVSPT